MLGDLLILGGLSVLVSSVAVGVTTIAMWLGDEWFARHRRTRPPIDLTPIIPIARARMMRRQRIPLVRDADRVPSSSVASPSHPSSGGDVELAACDDRAAPVPGSAAPQGPEKDGAA